MQTDERMGARRAWAGVVVCLAIGVIALVGVCAGANQILAEQQSISMGRPEEDIATLDPAFTGGRGSERPIAQNIYNTLVRVVPGSGDVTAVMGDLARSWDVSDDMLTWTFHLVRGVQFHKGYGELTADDVKFSFERLEERGSPHASTYDKITFEAVDRYTIRMHLDEIHPFLLTTLSNAAMNGQFITSRAAVEELGDAFALNPIGTGAFQLYEHRPRDRVILVRHEDYFRGPPILERVDVLFIPDQAAHMMASGSPSNRTNPARGGSLLGDRG